MPTLAIFRLLAERIDERFSPSALRQPRWSIRGNTAVLDWDSMGDIYVKGTTLMVVPRPDFIPFTEELKAEGWKRGSEHLTGGGGWLVYAYLRDGDAEIRVQASEFYDKWPEKRGAVPFFAPPPPALPRRMNKKWKAEYDVWDRKCREDEW
jgi:hypothetical protein